MGNCLRDIPETVIAVKNTWITVEGEYGHEKFTLRRMLPNGEWETVIEDLGEFALTEARLFGEINKAAMSIMAKQALALFEIARELRGKKIQ